MAKAPLQKLLAHYCITDGTRFRFADHDPADTGGFDPGKAEANDMLSAGVAQLSELQTRLYAQNRWSLLCIFQAMDAGGKDGTIKHVMSGVNPQGVAVHSFKAPGPEERAHDFLWRVSRHLPERGQIGIFNRSHYEEVLTVRVHPDELEKESLPPSLCGKHIWKHRLDDIAAFERYLARQGIVIRKFFLNISKEEQKRRLLARLDDPNKNWKFSSADLAERERWDDYMDAYAEAIAATATKKTPWYVVPADSKPFAHLIVVAAMIEALAGLDLRLPEPDAARCDELQKARRTLAAG